MSVQSPIKQRKRLRRPVRQRQRFGFGQRQRTVRALDPAPRRAGLTAQHLPFEHPGASDLVRGAGDRSRPSRRSRRRRLDGGDEPPDLGQGRRLDRARRLPVLRFRRKPMPSSKFRADITVIGVPLTAITNSTYTDPPAAPAVQEHHLSRRALRAARHRPEADRAIVRRSSTRAGRAVVLQRPRAGARPRLGTAEPEMPDRAAG